MPLARQPQVLVALEDGDERVRVLARRVADRGAGEGREIDPAQKATTYMITMLATSSGTAVGSWALITA